ncbi:hypothetical protein AAHC03_016843 [Spirometra sp. Aus1]
MEEFSKDLVWKDRIRKETQTAKIWPTRWLFLTKTQKEVLGDDIEQLIDKARPKIELPENMRPPVSKSAIDYLKPIPSPMPPPKTTSGLIGWRSGHECCLLERATENMHPQGDFLKRMGWPTECLP